MGRNIRFLLAALVVATSVSSLSGAAGPAVIVADTTSLSVFEGEDVAVAVTVYDKADNFVQNPGATLGVAQVLAESADAITEYDRSWFLNVTQKHDSRK